jgi:uncharacterized lipoprotein YddW (UPF0748 family)
LIFDRLSSRHSVFAIRFRGLLLGTLTATLFCTNLLPLAQAEDQTDLLVAQSLRQRNVVLGVIQSTDNLPEWQQITARLQAMGSAYQVIDWSQVQQAADLEPATVLFLPNIETISSEQLLAVQEWLGRGGRLIVSGSIGSQSQFGVREALRSLLGATWGFSLTQPSALETVPRSMQDWERSGETGDRVSGGVLIPNGLSSRMVAIWRDAPAGDRLSPAIASGGEPTAAAIVSTDRTTFLGWQWGTGSSEFDRSWLRAAVSRYGTLRPGTATYPIVPPSFTVPQSSAAALPPAQVPSRPQPQTTLSTQDPAEQVAPAGLSVNTSAQPITTMEAIAMRQELENLIGRFESALLSADSANSPTSLTAVQPTQLSLHDKSPDLLTASVADTITTAIAGEPEGNETVRAARRILNSFPQLIAQQDYRTARQQWLQARRMLWDHFPTDRPIVQPEIRAIWLDRGTIIRAGSRQGLAEIFDRLAAAGINTVFFETVNAGFPIYPSQVAPQQNPLVQGWDPLAAAVELAHDRGIELHAWVWTFAVGNRAHNALLNLPDDYPGPIISAHPNWANSDNSGNLIPLGQGKPFLDPANPEVRQYLLRLFNEIVTRYDVDGLQLDYIRYPFQDPGAGRTYGYGMAARQQFQSLTGVDPLTLTPSHPLWEQWTEFRAEQINSFVADVSQMLQRRRSDLILSTAVFALSEHERMQKIQQNWEVWARRGDVNLIVTMSYAMDTNSFLRLASPWLTSDDLGAALVLPSIRLLNLSDAGTIDQIQALRDLSAGGYSLFAAENLDDGLQGIFDRTQGQQNNQPIPYRQPFAAAASRYQALEREWSFLLANGQLWVRDPQLTQWRTQANALGQAFDQLAAHPSPQHLQAARELLQTFQTQFNGWMHLQSLSNDYRVRTWQYRLTTLESLLNYGERVVLEQPRSPAARTEAR